MLIDNWKNNDWPCSNGCVESGIEGRSVSEVSMSDHERKDGGRNE